MAVLHRTVLYSTAFEYREAADAPAPPARAPPPRLLGVRGGRSDGAAKQAPRPESRKGRPKLSDAAAAEQVMALLGLKGLL